ncbi:MAG: hypothetical protein LBJ17_06240 [Dysgonamonadaceae bacterium]|nr:hypothetical protein [Dysgonamonadaceae bacterium]
MFIAAAFASPVIAETVTVTLNEDDPPTDAITGDGYEADWDDGGTAFTYTIEDDAEVTFNGKGLFESILIDGVEATVNLDEADIRHEFVSPIRVVNGGTLHLNFKGDCNVIVNQLRTAIAAILVEEGSKIIINGDGQLKAFGSGSNFDTEGDYGGGAGIGNAGFKGSTPYTFTGEIIIESGTIIAQGGYNAASIGGGYMQNAGKITISGGVVVAFTIGGGSHGRGTETIIKGDATVYVQWALGNATNVCDEINRPEGQVFGDIRIEEDALVILNLSIDGQTFLDYFYPTAGENAVLLLQADDNSNPDEILKYGPSIDATFFDVRDKERNTNDISFSGTVTFSKPSAVEGDDVYNLGSVNFTVPKVLTVDAGGYTIETTGTIYANAGENVTGTVVGGPNYGVINNAITTDIPAFDVPAEKAYIADGRIYVPAGTKTVTVYSISGQIAGSAIGDAGIAAPEVKGIYVVVADGVATKLVVK